MSLTFPRGNHQLTARHTCSTEKDGLEPAAALLGQENKNWNSEPAKEDEPWQTVQAFQLKPQTYTLGTKGSLK